MDLGPESIQTTSSVVKSDADDHNVQRIYLWNELYYEVIFSIVLLLKSNHLISDGLGAWNFKPTKWGCE